MVHATVVELQICSHALYRHLIVVVVRTRHKAPADAVWLGNDVVGNDRIVALIGARQALEVNDRFAFLVEIARAQIVGGGCSERRVRLPWENARLTVHQPRLSEERPWIEFKVESHFAQPFLWYRTV